MNKWKMLLVSRKFWAAVVGLVVILIKNWQPDFPIEPELLSNMIAVIVAYIMGVAVEDGLRSVRG
ncbi:MAG: hypothetical protein CL609_08020 [Anaerolineaceae bacterium]|nr:hypothetical protein [Anaerolineaceae bacterium]